MAKKVFCIIGIIGGIIAIYCAYVLNMDYSITLYYVEELQARHIMEILDIAFGGLFLVFGIFDISFFALKLAEPKIIGTKISTNKTASDDKSEK